MADVNINKFRASVVRDGSKPASPGFIVSEGQDPVDPAGNGQNHLPVTIATAATGLSITDSQVLGGSGTVGQYIRGDGSLADFPQASGGGSSVSYYLNGSISQGTIGGVAYKELNKVPILGAGTDFTINADGYIASFLTDAGDPNLLEIPGGNWNFETYFSASSSGGSPSFYVELYKYDGTTFTLIASSSSSPELIAFGTNLNPYFSTLAVPTTTLALTDRLAVRYYVTHSGRTITLHTENNHLCQVVTTFTTGLTSLNGLTAQVQNLAVGTSGTDFNIASATATHTFNLPTASATNRGALSSADWSTFNNKQNALGYVPVPETRTITINGTSQDLSANRTYNVGTVTSVGLSSATSGVTIGGSPVTGVGAFTLAIATASGSQNGLLSSTDWTTFNNKQNALTNPVTGTGASGQVAYFTGTTAISSESNLFWDATNDRLGIGTPIPSEKLDVRGKIYINGTNTNIYLDNGGAGGASLLIGVTGSTSTYINSLDAHPIIFSATNVEAMRIFAGRNVHIGPTPSSDNGARLQVSGTGNFVNTINPLILRSTNATTMWTEYYYNTSTLSGYIGSGTGLIGGANASDFIIRSEADLVFASSGGNRRLTIASTGAATFSSSVGIGGATSTLGFLEVWKSGSSIAQFSIGQNATYHTDFFVDTTGNFYLQPQGTTRLTITSSGNVGIGTTSPSSKLHVFSGLGGSSTTPILLLENDATSPQDFLKISDIGATPLDVMVVKGNGNVLIGTTTDSGENLQVKNGRSLFQLPSGTNGAILKLGRSAGAYYWHLGINGATSNFEFYDNGLNVLSNINVTTGAYTAVSDINKKKDFEDSTIGLNAILGLKPTLYRMKSEFNTQKHLGFIAQEVKEYIPQAYMQNGDFIGLNEMPIIAALTKAIQELKQEIDTLKN